MRSELAGATQKLNLHEILADASRSLYAQVTQAAQAKAEAAPGSQAELEACNWHARALKETQAIDGLRDALSALVETSAAGLMDLRAMVAAADRGEVWVTNVGTRARLANLEAAIAQFSS